MKRIAYLLVVLFAVSFVTMAAQKKEGHAVSEQQPNNMSLLLRLT